MPEGTSIKTISAEIYFPIAFRYFVLITILYTIFYFFNKSSIQFILFILTFIVNFFCIVFLYRDLISTNTIASIYDPSMTFHLQNNTGGFVKIFVGVLFLTLLLQVASIAIMLVVFDYGKKGTNNYYIPIMTTSNAEIVKQYVTWLKNYFSILGVFAYIIAISAMNDGPARNILLNLGGLIPAVLLLGYSIYGTILAVKFLDVKKRKRALYT